MIKRSIHKLVVLLGVAALMAGTSVLVSGSGAVATSAAQSQATRQLGGHGGSDSPSEVDVSSLAAPTTTPGQLSSTTNLGALRMDGTKGPSSSQADTQVGTKPKFSGPSVVTPTTIKQNFAATDETQASCNCQPPDSNGTVGSNYIVEADNLSLSVWNKTGSPPTLVKRVSFASFLGTSDSLSDPRVFYDNAWQRFILDITVVPASSTATPALWFAASETNNPAGTWYIYRFGFGGGSFPAGTLLDYPMLGMSSDAVLMSTNNFIPNGSGGFSYNNSTAFAFPKERAYNGLGIGFGSYNVDFSTQPAFVEGVPQNLDEPVYFVASLIPYGKTGFDVYYMTNASHSGSTSMTFAGTANDPGGYNSAPPRAPQPGTSSTLDALDGRLQAGPHQLNRFLWFARTVNLGGGYPAVQYGAINTSNLSGTSDAIAYDSSTSYDWNPSIAVLPSGSSQYVFLNWAFTDPANGVATSMRVSGLSPADSIQSLAGVGTTLVSTFTTSQTRFGDYSAAFIDPNTAKTAVVVNETFDSSGNWQDHIARVGF